MVNQDTIKLRKSDRQPRADLLTIAAYGLGWSCSLAATSWQSASVPLDCPHSGGPISALGRRSLLLFIYVAIRRHTLPKGRALIGAVLFGFLQYGLFYALAYFAIVEVTAGLAAVIAASAPIFTLVFAGAARIERLTRWGVLGTAVSFSGIATIFGAWAGKEIPILYMLAAVGTVVVGALAAIIFKLLPPVNPHAMNAVGMLSGALFLLALSDLATKPSSHLMLTLGLLFYTWCCPGQSSFLDCFYLFSNAGQPRRLPTRTS